MGKKLFVGNLPFSADEAALESIFVPSGTVESVTVVMDRQTGRSKGFGFVEMATDEQAEDAIQRLNGTDYQGRAISVSIAKPMVPRNNKPRGQQGGNRFGGNFGNDRFSSFGNRRDRY